MAGTNDADRMRERAGESRLKLWVLMDAPRWQVTAGLLAVVFGSLVAAGSLSPVSLGAAVSNSDPIETLFQALVTAIITGVTLVVTITQLVLSPELGPVGDQRERMEGSTAFRDALPMPSTSLSARHSLRPSCRHSSTGRRSGPRSSPGRRRRRTLAIGPFVLRER